MSYPHIFNIQSFNKAKEDYTLGTPGVDKATKVALEVVYKIPNNIQRRHCLGNRSDMVKVALRAAFVPQAIDPFPMSSVVPPPYQA
jgi:hypothetical protein